MIALAHGDGTDWPNHALMEAAAHLRSLGEDVRLVRAGDRRNLWDQPTAIYGSSVFSHSAKTRAWIEREWGPVAWGGTGIWKWEGTRVVDTGPSLGALGVPEPVGPGGAGVAPDYSLYPGFTASVGFTARGCRLSCKFCVVPQKEGRPRAVRSVADIWRGKGHRKNILLLDNDFFGQPREEWTARIRELREGDFRVCFAQGINIRQVDEESARALATLSYSSTKFKRKRLYTAWDNLGDEEVVKRGIATLGASGIPPRHLMVYMLVGFAKGETWPQILYRFNELVALGCLPYPMPFDRSRKDLRAFARWASTGLYRSVPWEAYDVRIKSKKNNERTKT